MMCPLDDVSPHDPWIGWDCVGGPCVGLGEQAWVFASFSCGYAPPICGSGSGQINQGHFVQSGTRRPKKNVRGHLGRGRNDIAPLLRAGAR